MQCNTSAQCCISFSVRGCLARTSISSVTWSISHTIAQEISVLRNKLVRTSPPAKCSMVTIYLPILLASDKVCVVSTFTIIVFFQNKDRLAWFRQTPAQVRALQPTPRKRTEKVRTLQFPLLQGFPTAHRSLLYSSLPIHPPFCSSSSKRKQASNCFRHLQRLVRARRGGEK
jgi:hypothetical protein